jgi:hypothetical protein
LRDVSVSSGRMAIRKQAFYVQVCKEWIIEIYCKRASERSEHMGTNKNVEFLARDGIF